MKLEIKKEKVGIKWFTEPQVSANVVCEECPLEVEEFSCEADMWDYLSKNLERINARPDARGVDIDQAVPFVTEVNLVINEEQSKLLYNSRLGWFISAQNFPAELDKNLATKVLFENELQGAKVHQF